MENKKETIGSRENKLEAINAPEAMETIEKSIEISPTMDERVAICLIKPDAFSHREAIVKRLEESGLFIITRTTKELTEEFVEKEMTDEEARKPIVEATKEHLLSGPSEIILVRGDNVVRKLLDTVGLKTNPALCDPETIRYIYGNHMPKELEEGLKYYRNAAHRPSNNEEVKSDLKKFRDLL